jgi:flagellar L-ring protein precursor FlgH
VFFTSTGFAQSGAITGASALVPKQGAAPLKMSQASLIYQPAPRQRVYKEEDIISVNIKNEWGYNSIANNQRKKSIKTSAKITKWFKIPDIFAFPVKATDALPEMGGEIDHKTQNQGTLQRKENFNFTIACRVISEQENGNLVIDGTQSFVFGEESKVMHVCGIIRPEDIRPDNTIDGSRVSELTIREIPDGNVPDTFRRPWGTRMMEQWKPF